VIALRLRVELCGHPLRNPPARRCGLITNDEAGAGKGMPNAWSLTEKGRQAVQSMRSHAEDKQWAEGGRA
jgi:hypothetical protein